MAKRNVNTSSNMIRHLQASVLDSHLHQARDIRAAYFRECLEHAVTEARKTVSNWLKQAPAVGQARSV